MGKEGKKSVVTPQDVLDIREEIDKFFNTEDKEGMQIGRAQCGIYAFYDYDKEPIYVGQTIENIKGRVGRHLTGRRSDAVGKYVLDPVEVAEIEVWPFFDVTYSKRDRQAKAEAKNLMDKAEFTVFQKLLSESEIGAILNEKPPSTTDYVILPQSYRGRIIPEHIYEREKHPDIRIARRASTIANLARLISEREVRSGIRKTLLTQAKRLELLASERLRQLGIDYTFEDLSEESEEE